MVKEDKLFIGVVSVIGFSLVLSVINQRRKFLAKEKDDEMSSATGVGAGKCPKGQCWTALDPRHSACRPCKKEIRISSGGCGNLVYRGRPTNQFGRWCGGTWVGQSKSSSSAEGNGKRRHYIAMREGKPLA